MEVFGSSVTNAVRNGMHHVYADTLKTIIIPAYDKANNELFKQLYDTFNKGTMGCKSTDIRLKHFSIVCRCSFNCIVFHSSSKQTPINWPTIQKPTSQFTMNC